MKIHEYQAKLLLAHYGIPIPRGRVARTPAQAARIAWKGTLPLVVKAQVHAGGRGKGGGIRVASTVPEVEEAAAALLGSRLVTPQTGEPGLPVNAVLIEEAVTPRQELYLAIAIDTVSLTPVIIASRGGGVEIEEAAAQDPEAVIRCPVDPLVRELHPYQAREVADRLGLAPEHLVPVAEVITNLFRLFVEQDCTLAEVNPLAITGEERLVALDAKLSFDDSALFRHADIARLRDPGQEAPQEAAARSLGIVNYVQLSGNIGVVVNGAGLAMAVMDALKQAGGAPANFLDIGTVNRPERVVNAFKILTGDPQVRCILVNIFGGMARAEVIAEGIVAAFRQIAVRVPVVVRLKGTHAEEGERVLAQLGDRLIRADTFSEAIERAVTGAR